MATFLGRMTQASKDPCDLTEDHRVRIPEITRVAVITDLGPRMVSSLDLELAHREGVAAGEFEEAGAAISTVGSCARGSIWAAALLLLPSEGEGT